MATCTSRQPFIRTAIDRRFTILKEVIMERIIRALAMLCIMLTIIFEGASLFGQAVNSAQISGVVEDPSGAVIPTAKVKATQTDTGLVRMAETGSTGSYVLPNLPVGPYRLEVNTTGFKAYVQSGIILQVGENVTINVKLQLGQATQSVKVSANAKMVQTNQTFVSQVIDQRRIVDLPLNGREATSLILLSGASVTGTGVGSKNYSTNDIQGSSAISIAGGQANGTNYLMDGGDNNDAFNNVNLPFPFPDAIREFSVQTNSLPARYGLHPGGVVNVVTKSGTNHIHGDLFEFLRNGDLNARNFFAPTQDSLKRNQFGGTIGGPILKDKLFGFFGYQGTRIRTAPPQSISYVPTQAVLNGNFSQLESASCQANGKARTIIDPATGQPFANGFVSPSLFNPQALALLKYIPVSSNPCGQITYAIPSPEDENQYIGRVDWNQSAKNAVFGRYFVSNLSNPPEFSNNLLLANRAGVIDGGQSAVLGDTYTITPTTLNSVHATWTRLRITRGPASDVINPNDVGINVYNASPNLTQMKISGYFSASPAATRLASNNAVQLADDVDTIHGRHHISFGGEWIHNQLNQASDDLANGDWTFNGQFSGDALLDFLLGLPNNFTQNNPTQENWRQNYVGLYVQDNVRISSRFNFDIGLRWEPYLPEVDKNGIGGHFDPVAFAEGKKSSQYVNAPPGLFFEGDPGIPHGYVYNKLGDFEPRVGLVWDPTGSGRQAIGTGYGIFYDEPEIFAFHTFSSNSPWAGGVTIPSPSGGLTNPFLGFPGGNPFPFPMPPSQNQPFPSEGAYTNQPIDLHPTYMQQWDLSYQRQIGNNWRISAVYIGNKTTHLWTAIEGNPAVYIPGTCNGRPCSTTSNTNQRRVLYLENPVTGSLYSNIRMRDDGANSEYNGILFQAEHRFSSHYTILANYTYSHCIAEVGNDTGQQLGGSQYQDPYNRNASRGNCDFDIRHNFNASFVAAMPSFANRWENRLLSNWQLSPIFQFHSGYWFTPTTGVDNSLTGVGKDQPNAVGNPYVKNTSTLQWITPSAFIPNALGTFGNAGMDSIVGPSFFGVDADVSRFIKIRESQQLEVRFEFFNLTNHVNFDNPNSNLKNSKFGIIQGAGDPRILQFGLKYHF